MWLQIWTLTWMLLMILRRKNLGVLHPALNPGDTGLASATTQTTIWIRGTNCSLDGDAKRTIQDKSTYAISDLPSYYCAFSHTAFFFLLQIIAIFSMNGELKYI